MSTEKIKILLAEDDPNLGLLLEEYLQAKGYVVTLAVNGKEGFDMFCKHSYDLCLLDVMMPLKDGFTLAKEVRVSNKQVPIIFLTAKSMKEDTIEGFNAGGDDYMTKPFSTEELLARIQAVLRRSMKAMALENTETQLLKGGTEDVKLTTKEGQLLRLLAINQNDILDRSFALKTIWHDDNYFNSRSMDVYITKLRKYLKQDPKVEIVNIHGKGFKLLVNH